MSAGYSGAIMPASAKLGNAAGLAPVP